MLAFSAVMTTTQSAVQQASLIALGVSLPLIPYLMARSAGVGGRYGTRKRRSANEERRTDHSAPLPISTFCIIAVNLFYQITD